MSDSQVENGKATAPKPVEKQPQATKASKPADEAPKAAAAAAKASPVVPEPVRDAVATSVAQDKEGYAHAKAAAEETSEAFEESLAAALRGANEFNAQVVAAIKEEAFARYDLVRDLARAGTPLDAFAIQGRYLRARIDAAQARGAALAKLVTRVAEETTGPARETVAKAIRALTPAA